MTVSTKDHQLVFVNHSSVSISGGWFLSANVLSLLLCLTLQIGRIVSSDKATRARRTEIVSVKSSALLHHGVIRLKSTSVVVLDHVSVLKLERSRGL